MWSIGNRMQRHERAAAIYQEILALIHSMFSGPDQSRNRFEAWESINMAYGLYLGAAQLVADGAMDVDEEEGTRRLSAWMQKNRSMLDKCGGVFIPLTEDGSHLKPANFCAYLQRPMMFFCDQWPQASLQKRKRLIIRVLTHNTLTVPRLVSYCDSYSDHADLSLTILAWLENPMIDVFSGAQLTKSYCRTAREQIVSQYDVKCVPAGGKTYRIFWSSLIIRAWKAFDIGDEGRLLDLFKSNRVVLHTELTGCISVAAIDEFIDIHFAAVWNHAFDPFGDSDDEP